MDNHKNEKDGWMEGTLSRHHCWPLEDEEGDSDCLPDLDNTPVVPGTPILQKYRPLRPKNVDWSPVIPLMKMDLGRHQFVWSAQDFETKQNEQ